MPDGTGNLIELAQAELAQASPTAGAAIGRVESAIGRVTLTRVDGSKVSAEQGTSIFQGDLVETAFDGKVGLVFADNSTFSLAEKGKMTIDEMVYDPGTQAGKSVVAITEGIFSFVSGQIAKTGSDAMVMKTPVATIGIRGTSGAGKAAPIGTANSFALLPDPGGSTGEATISTVTGRVTVNQPYQVTQVSNPYVPPTAPVVLPPAVVARAFGAATAALPATPAAAAGGPAAAAAGPAGPAAGAAGAAAGPTGPAAGPAAGAAAAAAAGAALPAGPAGPAGQALIAAALGGPGGDPAAITQAFNQALAGGGSLESALAAATTTIVANDARPAFVNVPPPKSAVDNAIDAMVSKMIGAITGAVVDPGSAAGKQHQEEKNVEEKQFIEQQAEKIAEVIEQVMSGDFAGIIEGHLEGGPIEGPFGPGGDEFDLKGLLGDTFGGFDLGPGDVFGAKVSTFGADGYTLEAGGFGAFSLQAGGFQPTAGGFENIIPPSGVFAEFSGIEVFAAPGVAFVGGIGPGDFEFLAAGETFIFGTEEATFISFGGPVPTSAFDEVITTFTTGSDTKTGGDGNTNFYVASTLIGGTDSVDGGLGTNQLAFDGLDDKDFFVTASSGTSGSISISRPSDSASLGSIAYTNVNQFLFADGAAPELSSGFQSGTSSNQSTILNTATTSNDPADELDTDVIVLPALAAGDTGEVVVGTSSANTITLSGTIDGAIVFGKGGGDTIDVQFAGDALLIGGIGTSDNEDTSVVDGIIDTHINTFTYASLTLPTGATGLQVFLKGSSDIGDSLAGDGLVKDNASSPSLFNNLWDVGAFVGSSGADTIALSSGSVGNGGWASINGGGGNDTIQVNGSGTKIGSILGGAGDDSFDLAAGLTYSSTINAVDGGAGTADQATVRVASGTVAPTIANVETVSINGSSATGAVTFSGAGVGAAATTYNVTSWFPIGTLTINNLNAAVTSFGTSSVSGALAVTLSSTGAVSATGGSGNDSFTFSAAVASGSSVNGAAGTDSVTLGNFTNTISLSNVETVTGDAGADSVSLGTNLSSGASVNLAGGTDALNLANGANTASITNVETITMVGTTTQNSLTLTAAVSGTTINGTAATNDTLTLANGTNSVTVSLIESVTGGTGADTIVGSATVETISGGAGTDTITGAGGADSINVGASDGAADVVRYTSLSDGGAAGATTGFDVISNAFNNTQDTLAFVGLGLNGTTAASVAGGAIDLTGTNGVFYINNATVSSLTSLADVATAIGTLVAINASDKAIYLVQNSTNSATGVYAFQDDGAGNTAVATSELSMLAQVDVAIDNTDVTVS